MLISLIYIELISNLFQPSMLAYFNGLAWYLVLPILHLHSWLSFFQQATPMTPMPTPAVLTKTVQLVKAVLHALAQRPAHTTTMRFLLHLSLTITTIAGQLSSKNQVQ